MTSNIVTVEAVSPVVDVSRAMRDDDIGGVLVTNALAEIGAARPST